MKEAETLQATPKVHVLWRLPLHLKDELLAKRRAAYLGGTGDV